jgi:hypothetical protein
MEVVHDERKPPKLPIPVVENHSNLSAENARPTIALQNTCENRPPEDFPLVRSGIFPRNMVP